MKYSIFKASPYKSKDNPNMFAGAALSWNYWVPQDNKPVLHLELVKQKNWDDSTKKGSFFNSKENPEHSIRVKFNETEIGNLIHAIRTYGPFRAYHSFDDDKTNITFLPVTKKPKEGESEGVKAYSLTVKRNGALTIGMGIELSEAEVIRVCLENALVDMLWAANKMKDGK